MAEAKRARTTPLHRGLPDEIAIWEILVRLSPKRLLRCRAVCRSWRRATSTRRFLLAHHARQPSLPLVYGQGLSFNFGSYGSCEDCLDIIPFDHRDAAAQLEHVATLDNAEYMLKACYDGLLIISTEDILHGGSWFSVCNPASRQYARLPLLRCFTLLGMYHHPLTGEYRLLLYLDSNITCSKPPRRISDACYVFTLGSYQPPRHIGRAPPDVDEQTPDAPVLFRGCLHWYRAPRGTIMVFDTTAESFREMRAPVVPDCADLFEMDGMLVMSSYNDVKTLIDIWMLEDYESEVWTLECRIELLVEEIRMRCGRGKYENRWDVVVVPGDGEVLVLVRYHEWLLHVDMDSKLAANFYRERLGLTQFQLKQTLVPHNFFPTLEGDILKDSPFI